MNTIHDSGPQSFAVRMGIARQVLIVVVAAPDAAGVVRCVADEPDVFVIGCGAGLSSDGLTGSRNTAVSGAGGIGDNILHGRSQY